MSQILSEIIKAKVCDPQNSKNVDINWTNNNSESLNHVLEVLVDWKSKPILELVHKLSEYTNAQFKDLRRALVGVGQYKLSQSHKRFQVSKSVWVSKSETIHDSEIT